MLLLQYFLYYTFLALTLTCTSLKRLSLKTKNTFLNYKYCFRNCIVDHTCNIKKFQFSVWIDAYLKETHLIRTGKVCRNALII